MKKLRKLKLDQLNKNEIEKRKMHTIKGGCSCGCLYAGEPCGPGDDYYGGSDEYDNFDANWDIV